MLITRYSLATGLIALFFVFFVSCSGSEDSGAEKGGVSLRQDPPLDSLGTIFRFRDFEGNYTGLGPGGKMMSVDFKHRQGQLDAVMHPPIGNTISLSGSLEPEGFFQLSQKGGGNPSQLTGAFLNAERFVAEWTSMAGDPVFLNQFVKKGSQSPSPLATDVASYPGIMRYQHQIKCGNREEYTFRISWPRISAPDSAANALLNASLSQQVLRDIHRRCNDPELPEGYQEEIDFNIMHWGLRMVSLITSTKVKQGSGEPELLRRQAYSYDLQTGEQILIDNLFMDNSKFIDLLKSKIEQYRGKEAVSKFRSGFSYYFTGHSISCFSLFEGDQDQMVEIAIPYSEIADWVVRDSPLQYIIKYL